MFLECLCGPKTNAAPANKNVIDQMQSKWDSTQSYKADFKQVVFSKRVGSRDETQGTLFVSKPGKLRWESNDNSIQILNPKKLFVISRNARRGTTVVDVYPDPAKAMGMAALDFLSGKRKFREVYQISIVSEKPDVAEAKFVPKAGHNEDSLIAEIDKNSYLLRSLTSETADSRIRIEFFRINTNVKLEESLFDYKPAPTDVVHNQ